MQKYGNEDDEDNQITLPIKRKPQGYKHRYDKKKQERVEINNMGGNQLTLQSTVEPTENQVSSNKVHNMFPKRISGHLNTKTEEVKSRFDTSGFLYNGQKRTSRQSSKEIQQAGEFDLIQENLLTSDQLKESRVTQPKQIVESQEFPKIQKQNKQNVGSKVRNQDKQQINSIKLKNNVEISSENTHKKSKPQTKKQYSNSSLKPNQSLAGNNGPSHVQSIQQQLFLKMKTNIDQKVENQKEKNMNYDEMKDKQNKIQVNSESIDRHPEFNGQDKPPSIQDEKKEFIDKYATKIKIPGGYIQDMKFYIKSPEFQLHLLNLHIPKDFIERTACHCFNGDRISWKDDEFYKMMEDGVVLIVYKTDEIDMLSQVGKFSFNSKSEMRLSISQDGSLIGFLNKDDQTIQIYELDDHPENLLKKLKYNQFKCKFNYGKILKKKEKVFSDDLNFINSIEFDPKNRYLIGQGDNNLLFLNIEKKVHYVWTALPNLYEKIISSRFESQNKNNFKCHIACKKANQKVIQIIQYTHEMRLDEDESKNQIGWQAVPQRIKDVQFINTLDYLKENDELPKICFHHDFKSLLFYNKNEIFIQKNEKEGSIIQIKINLLDGGIIKHVEPDSIGQKDKLKGFYIIVGKNFDLNLTIRHTDKNDFEIKIPRDHETKELVFHDFLIQQNKKSTECNLFIGIERDFEFFSDQLSYNQKLFDQQNTNDNFNENLLLDDKKIKTHSRKYVGAMQICWPYFCFSPMPGYILFYNVYNNQACKIQVAKEITDHEILASYITETKDLFIVSRNKEKYEIHRLDLDKTNVMEFKGKDAFEYKQQYKLELIHSYTAEKVNWKKLVNFMVRGSSEKDHFDMNNKLIIYLVHENELHQYVKFGKGENKHYSFNLLDKVLNRQIFLINDNQFMYLREQGDKGQQTLEIVKVKSSYSDQKTKVMYDVKSYQENILAFNLDHSKQLIMIICSVKSINEDKIIFKIISYKGEKFIEQELDNDHLINRFQRRNLVYQDGHFYFENQVIKIRYDLIMRPNNRTLQTSEFLNHYKNVFDTGGRQIQSLCPYQDSLKNKLAYILADRQGKTCREIWILPFLHDRKLYLQRIKQNTEYFFNTIQTQFYEISRYNKTIEQQTKQQDPSMKSIFYESSESKENVTLIMCINKTESKFYVYKPNGILVRRVEYEDITKVYGTSKAVSQDGKNFIFQRNQNIEKDHDKIEVHLITIDIFEIKHHKTIDVMNILMKNEVIKNYQIDRCTQEDHVLHHGWDKIMIQSKLEFFINNKKEILIRVRINITDKVDYIYIFVQNDVPLGKGYTVMVYENFNDEIDMDQHKYFQWEQSDKDDNTIEDKTNQNYLSNDAEHISNAHLSDNFVYIQCPGHIQFIDIENGLDNQIYINQKNEKISKEEAYQKFKQSHNQIKIPLDLKQGQKIHQIIVGGQRSKQKKGIEIIIIDIQYGEEDHHLSVWDMTYNVEYSSFDIGNQKYDVIWDNSGQAYIILKDEVIITSKSCNIQAYGIHNFAQKKTKSDDENAYQQYKGIRFDGNNHNWLLQNMEFISLSHCYMTLVIRESDKKDIRFDQEAYNYIINRRTCFLDPDLILNRHDQLDEILNNFSKIDPRLINLLLYSHTVKFKNDSNRKYINSSIYIACGGVSETGNYKSTDLVLKYMSQLQNKNPYQFSGLFFKLITLKSFQDYFDSLVFQSQLSAKCQVLKIKSDYYNNEQWSKDMILLNYSNSMNIGESHFKQQDSDDQHRKTFPVSIKSMSFDWFMNDTNYEQFDSVMDTKDKSAQFLRAIYEIEDMSIYEIPSIQMLIEFLFQKYRLVYLGFQVPCQLIQITSFYLMIFENEDYASHWKDCTGGTIQQDDFGKSRGLLVFYTLVYICMYYPNIRTLSNYIKTIIQHNDNWWNNMSFLIADIVFLTFPIINAIQLQEEIYSENCLDKKMKLQHLRIYLSLNLICLVFKTANVFILIDSVSPLIDLILAVFRDISSFMVIFSGFIMLFAACFWLLAKNIVDYDTDNCLDPDQYCNDMEGELVYSTATSSLWYIFMMQVGFFDNGGDFPGFRKQNTSGYYGYHGMYVLHALFIVTTFMTNILLMNMLIAIMAQTFADRNPVKDQIRIKNHLKFIISNWYLHYIAFSDIKNKAFLKQLSQNYENQLIRNIRYIVVAFFSKEEEQDEELIGNLYNQIDEIHKSIRAQNIQKQLQQRLDQQSLKESEQKIIYETRQIINSLQPTKNE